MLPAFHMLTPPFQEDMLSSNFWYDFLVTHDIANMCDSEKYK